MACEPDAERLRALLQYDPETGVLRWAVSRRGRVARPGVVAGRPNRAGYIRVKIDGFSYAAHRIAWVIVHGERPRGDIDHINGDRADNRLANLRDVPRRVNRQNMRRALARSKTGLLGVTCSPKRSRQPFSARITVNGTTHRLGYFATAQLAHAAYLAAKRQLHEGNTL